MILYFAGGDYGFSYFKDWPRFNILVPYFWVKKQRITPEAHWFIDSGAFSVYTRVIDSIDIEEMSQDLLKWGSQVYAGLDVIGDAEKSYQNCRFMKDQGLDPIPTFHYGEDFEWLKRYLEEGWKYIALGGIALKASRPRVNRWLDKCFFMTKDFWPIKIHGFAVMSESRLRRYPFYSTDSTRWLNASKWGQSNIYQGDHLKYRNQKLHVADRVWEEIRYWIRLEEELTALWKARGIDWPNSRENSPDINPWRSENWLKHHGTINEAIRRRPRNLSRILSGTARSST